MNKHKKNNTLSIIERGLIILAVGLFVLACAFQFAPPKPCEYITYTVQSGDTLWGIAREVYGDEVDIRRKIDEILRLNGIEGGRIVPGQELKVGK